MPERCPFCGEVLYWLDWLDGTKHGGCRPLGNDGEADA